MPVMLKNILILSTKRLVQTKLNVTGNDNGVYNSEHIVIGILVFLVLMLGALVSIIGYILMQEINNILPLLSDMSMKTVSVYCDDLSLSPDEDFDTFEAKKGGMKVSLDKRQNYVCSERNLTFFVQKIVERQLRLRQSKGLDSERYLSCGNQSLQRASGDLTVCFSGISHHQTYKEPLEEDTMLLYTVKTRRSRKIVKLTKRNTLKRKRSFFKILRKRISRPKL